MVNIRQKGQEGEREVATALNAIVMRVLVERKMPPPFDTRTGKLVPIVQRNQNQSAVGGGDLSNTFGLSIEVKRQEQLSINTWWAQCEAAAMRNNELPVLVFRQNTKGGGVKKWRVILYAQLELYAPVGYNAKHMKARVELSWDDFLQWFYHWVDNKILHGEIPKV